MSSPRVLALVRDLLLRSRIEAAADALGIEVVYASSIETAHARCAELQPHLLFADLSDSAFPLDKTAGLSAVSPATRLIGFASHVDMKALKAAKDAGFTRTLSRSEFTAMVPELLKT
jgi:DNA-binding NarL/FixJ family response regulator